MAVPRVQDLLNPGLEAIKGLGGSASITEMDDEVTKFLKLSEEEISQPHDERQTKLQYNLAWARTYLKMYGLLDNSVRGVWVVTAKGREVTNVPARLIKKGSKTSSKVAKVPSQGVELAAQSDALEVAEAVLEQNWREKLSTILRGLAPDAFERLCQRLLRESGFTQVTVTGRSGDGGIDGFGLVRLGGLLSFPILFQCKRYQGSVSPSVIRDFRGAMVGRADRGLVITTGTFSREAKKEATRDGAPPIDLLDGEQLMDKLFELKLGVGIKVVEEIVVQTDWFKDI